MLAASAPYASGESSGKPCACFEASTMAAAWSAVVPSSNRPAAIASSTGLMGRARRPLVRGAKLDGRGFACRRARAAGEDLRRLPIRPTADRSPAGVVVKIEMAADPHLETLLVRDESCRRLIRRCLHD